MRLMLMMMMTTVCTVSVTWLQSMWDLLGFTLSLSWFSFYLRTHLFQKQTSFDFDRVLTELSMGLPPPVEAKASCQRRSNKAAKMPRYFARFNLRDLKGLYRSSLNLSLSIFAFDNSWMQGLQHVESQARPLHHVASPAKSRMRNAWTACKRLQTKYSHAPLTFSWFPVRALSQIVSFIHFIHFIHLHSFHSFHSFHSSFVWISVLRCTALYCHVSSLMASSKVTSALPWLWMCCLLQTTHSQAVLLCYALDSLSIRRNEEDWDNLHWTELVDCQWITMMSRIQWWRQLRSLSQCQEKRFIQQCFQTVKLWPSKLSVWVAGEWQFLESFVHLAQHKKHTKAYKSYPNRAVKEMQCTARACKNPKNSKEFQRALRIEHRFKSTRLESLWPAPCSSSRVLKQRQQRQQRQPERLSERLFGFPSDFRGQVLGSWQFSRCISGYHGPAMAIKNPEPKTS